MTAALAQLDQADRMLAEIVTAEDARVTADYAAAACEVAKKARLGLSASNRAKAIEIKALMRLADLVDEGRATGQIADRAGRKYSHEQLTSLSDIGTTSAVVQRAQAVRDAFDADEVDALAKDLTAARGELTLGRLVSLANRAHPDANDWYTPPWLFDQIGLKYDLDVCAPADVLARTCPAANYYTAADDGLAQPWHGLVWCNPPYSDPEAWADRMADHGNGILLTHMPNNAGWMVRAQWAASSVRLIQSMHFVRPDGSEQRPGYSLMLATFGDHLRGALADMHWSKVGPLWM